MAAHLEPELAAWLSESNLSVSRVEALTGDVSRRRYYRLTARGRALLRLEADRLQDLIDAARASVPG